MRLALWKSIGLVFYFWPVLGVGLMGLFGSLPWQAAFFVANIFSYMSLGMYLIEKHPNIMYYDKRERQKATSYIKYRDAIFSVVGLTYAFSLAILFAGTIVARRQAFSPVVAEAAAVMYMTLLAISGAASLAWMDEMQELMGKKACPAT